VSVADGKQIVDINEKGGYSPKTSTAKAGMPTVIRVTTRGTFDCSSYVVIPGIGYSVHLPPTGEKEIEIPPQKAGSIMQVFCGMGMYNFQIAFN
jgi:plastocyanin domain-containing protein